MCPVGSTGGEYGVRIVTGNDLKTGDVIWWTGQGWSRHLAKAVDAGNQAEAILAREDAERRVNAGYIIEAEMTEDGPIPRQIKDRIRARRPPVRADLGLKHYIPILTTLHHVPISCFPLGAGPVP